MRAAIGCVVLATTLVVGGHGAQANTATLTDPNDSSRKLDVQSGTVNNTASTITYGITMDAFTAADVARVIFEFDFTGDGVADNCLRITPSSGGLEGSVLDSCNGSNLVGTADSVTIVGGNVLTVALNVQVLKDAGLNNASSYGFRVLTLDFQDKDFLPGNVTDTAPDTGFVTHALGTVYCGATVTANVKLLANMTGCRGDGLSAGKSKLKINLNGFTISSAYGSTPPASGSTVGVNVGAFKTVSVTNGTITGFGTGVRFANSLNGKDKLKQSYVKAMTITVNTTGIDLAAPTNKYIGISGNTITNNKGNGIRFVGDSIKISTNTVTGNTLDGIVQTAGTKANLKGNTVSTNGTQPPATPATADGIDIDGTLAKINANTANSNDGDGINAPGDATGSGNAAASNFGTQCTPAALC